MASTGTSDAPCRSASRTKPLWPAAQRNGIAARRRSIMPCHAMLGHAFLRRPRNLPMPCHAMP